MQSILILGAGRSASSLIRYLLEEAEPGRWTVTVADMDFILAQEKTGSSPFGRAVSLDISHENDRRALIKSASVVISMLPPQWHQVVAYDCLLYRKHLLTASYLSQEMKALNAEARDKGLLFLNEMGLDPGIDHMSAMAMLSEIRSEGGQIESFRSYTGGLISLAFDNNPWHYKITWNPKNVVLAGNQTAVFKEQGQVRFLPYQQLFENAQVIEVEGGDQFEMYPNRDSIGYIDLYGLKEVQTIIRGTLRHLHFCQGWAALVRLGLTDDRLIVRAEDFRTYRQLLEAFLPLSTDSLSDKLAKRLGHRNDYVVHQIEWLFDQTPLAIKAGTIAEHLQYLLLMKWKLRESDRDLVVMHHEFEYFVDGKKFRRSSTLKEEGATSIDTAMSRLVGLPLAISAKLLLAGELTCTGVHIPVESSIFKPVLRELRELDVVFREETLEL